MAYDKQFGGPVPNLAAASRRSARRQDADLQDPPRREVPQRPDDRRGRLQVRLGADADSEAAVLGATSYLSSIVGASAMMAGKAKQPGRRRGQRRQTLVVHLTAPDFTILDAFTQPIAAPVPSEEVERLGEASSGQTPVGTGPFKIIAYDAPPRGPGSSATTHYIYAGLPYLDAVSTDWGVDPQIELLQLQHGDTDIIGTASRARGRRRCWPPRRSSRWPCRGPHRATSG